MEKKKKKRAYTPNRAASNKRYDEKTYKKIGFALRIEDDADIIEDIEAAQREGLSLREWLRYLWQKKEAYLKEGGAKNDEQ